MRVIHAREDAAGRRWIATHGLAGSAATRFTRVRRPAWPATPSRTRLTRIRPLATIGVVAAALVAAAPGRAQTPGPPPQPIPEDPLAGDPPQFIGEPAVAD